jgi:hypothetical protein
VVTRGRVRRGAARRRRERFGASGRARRSDVISLLGESGAWVGVAVDARRAEQSKAEKRAVGTRQRSEEKDSRTFENSSFECRLRTTDAHLGPGRGVDASTAPLASAPTSSICRRVHSKGGKSRVSECPLALTWSARSRSSSGLCPRPITPSRGSQTGPTRVSKPQRLSSMDSRAAVSLSARGDVGGFW